MNRRVEARINGVDLFGDPIIERPDRGKLADLFGYPPFSVLNSRDGWWAERKAAWKSLGIRSEIGRDARARDIAPSDCAGGNNGILRPVSANNDYYAKKHATEEKLGRKLSHAEFEADHYRAESDVDCGTSIFDPVLCELLYRWFCPAGGQIVDPFAGGSVRGIVASIMGYRYWGSELRPEQVVANYEQSNAIVPDGIPQDTEDDVEGAIYSPYWEIGDSRETMSLSPDADLVMSCPPYGNLEVYSDDPADLSTMSPDDFEAAYFDIIAKACDRLKDNRFAAFVVGDYRDKKTGVYRDFVSQTIRGFRRAGLDLYNEAILVTPLGSLQVRVNKQFKASRKLGKTHQNVLVFVKGDPKTAAREIEGGWIAMRLSTRDILTASAMASGASLLSAQDDRTGIFGAHAADPSSPYAIGEMVALLLMDRVRSISMWCIAFEIYGDTRSATRAAISRAMGDARRLHAENDERFFAVWNQARYLLGIPTDTRRARLIGGCGL